MKRIDESLRELLRLGEKGTIFFNEIYSQIPNACFEFLSDVKKFSEGEVNTHKVNTQPEIITQTIKGIAKFYNAKLVGITEMQDYHYYSHRGRIGEHYRERFQ